MRIQHILASLLLAASVLPAFAVSDKEMEQARTYTAIAYLRYANDASGYLDEVKATSISELKGKLKKQEIENIKSFESVAMPKDYASWDKARLSEYWSSTFFSSPGLIEKGRNGGAKARVKRNIEAMTVSATTAADAKPAAEQAENVSADPLDGLEADPNASAQAASLTDSIASAKKKLEEAMQEEETVKKSGNSYTWVYVAILAVLVGIVIWLVIFASRVMKHNEEEKENAAPAPYRAANPEDEGAAERERAALAENADLRERFAATLASKNEEIRILTRRAENLESENQSLRAELALARENVAAATRQSEDMKQRALAAEARAATPAVTSAPAAAPRHAAEPEQQRPAAAPTERRVSAPQPAATPATIFLGRANNRGLFVRADRKLNIGHTLFRLDTTDGYSGTFRVAADPTVWEMALLTPRESLAGACTSPDLDNTTGMNRIVTETPGTAIFEGGCWKVIRKAKIRYEQ